MRGQESCPVSRCLEFVLSDLSLPSPCFVIDAEKLRENDKIMRQIGEGTGARILLALKAYSCWPTFGMLSKKGSGSLAGTCASSVDEARLGFEEFGGETHAFAAAWNDVEIAELAEFVDHIVFNSLEQWRRFKPYLLEASKRREKPVKCGLRVNPEHSEGAVAIYNPCAPGSRLGIRIGELKKASKETLAGISGLHFHTLCEQNADALARTLDAFEDKFKDVIAGMEWLNFGGGHHITRADYDRVLLQKLILRWKDKYGCEIYLEPGEAVALDAGWLRATVLDIVNADIPVAILDASAACHMPDVLEMPYRPRVYYKRKDRIEQGGEIGEKAWNCRLAGKSCLAGDVIGEYSFVSPLKPGDILAFADMAIYSMVKTNTFNGLRLPAIGVFDPDARPEFRVLREFGYQDFKTRLG